MHKRLSREIFERIFLPLLILVLVSVIYFIYYERLGPALLKETVERFGKWLFSMFVVIIAFLLHRLSGAFVEWYGANIASKTLTSLDDEFLPIFKKLTSFLIWIIAVLIIFSRFGIDTKGLITALGVSSLAIALAAQDTISNIISGFLIVVDRPFRIGDSIKLPSGEKVKVLEISLRRSKFLSEDGAIIIVPNLELSKSKIINYTYGGERKK